MILFIPAVDIKGGKVVRLYKGQDDKATHYSDDPVSVIKQFQDMKIIKFLHIVDLDGAIDNHPQEEILKSFKGEVCIDFEWAGGVRSLGYFGRILALGAKRIVVSSAVLQNPRFLEETLSIFGPEKMAVSVDVLEGKIAVRGWKDVYDVQARDFISGIIKKGCKNIIITDITRDGTLEGVQSTFFKELIEDFDADFVIGGGVSSYDDLYKIRNLNLPSIKGIISGKAIYEKKIDPVRAQHILSD